MYNWKTPFPLSPRCEILVDGLQFDFLIGIGFPQDVEWD